MRRFEQHFLPRGFVKIRHYGYLQNHGKRARLNAVRQTMQLQPLQPIINIPVAVRMLEQYGKDISLCPKCQQGKLVLISTMYLTEISTRLKRTFEAPDLRNKASP